MGEIAYIGIGSNLGDRLNYLQQGLEDVVDSPEVCLLATSSIFASDPIGTIQQPNYLNAVFSVRTSLRPGALLRHMQSIEDTHGRQRTIHWGPRTLDLDLLLYGEYQVDSVDLSLPHRFLLERCFVLVPLCEIASDCLHPTTGRSLADHLRDLDCTAGLEALAGRLLSTS